MWTLLPSGSSAAVQLTLAHWVGASELNSTSLPPTGSPGSSTETGCGPVSSSRRRARGGVLLGGRHDRVASSPVSPSVESGAHPSTRTSPATAPSTFMPTSAERSGQDRDTSPSCDGTPDGTGATGGADGTRSVPRPVRRCRGRPAWSGRPGAVGRTPRPSVVPRSPRSGRWPRPCPSAGMSWRTVVSAGRDDAATALSSNPMTETSSGTRRPRSSAARSTPRARTSE